MLKKILAAHHRAFSSPSAKYEAMTGLYKKILKESFPELEYSEYRGANFSIERTDKELIRSHYGTKRLIKGRE